VPPRDQDASGQYLRPIPFVKEPLIAYDGSTGLPVLCMYGRHYDLTERATIELIPDRGSLSLPVQGSMADDAIMSVVDDRGVALLKMRLRQSNWGRWFQEVEVLLESPGPITTDLILVIAIASINIKTYFRRPVPTGPG